LPLLVIESELRLEFVLAGAYNPPPKPMGNVRIIKKCCLFKENFRVVCFIGIKVQNVLPSSAHPFCWYADKM